MPRYIDAEKLKAENRKHFPLLSLRCELNHIIDEQPTADVRENVRGEWLEKEVVDDRKDAKIQQWQQARCSVCGKWHTTPYMYYFDEFDFCPNCGADMRGGNT